MNEAPASMPTTLPKGPLVIPCPPPYSRGGAEIIFLFRLGLGSFFGMAWDTSSTRYLKNVCLHFWLS